MRQFLGFLALLLSFSVISQEYTVTVAIDGQPENEVRNAARVKVQWEAALNYPVLISGNEYTNEMDEYRAEIAAMTVGAVNVETISEQWLRDQNEFRYTAVASLNETVTMKAFENLRSNVSLQKELTATYSKLNALIAEKTVDADQFLLNVKKATAASKVFFVQDTLESTLKAKETLRHYFVRLIIYDYYLPFIESLKFKLIDAGAGYVIYEATSDWYEKLPDDCKKVVITFDRGSYWDRDNSYDYYERCIDSSFSEHSIVLRSAANEVKLNTPIEGITTSRDSGDSVFHFRLNGLTTDEVNKYLQEPQKISDEFRVVFIP